MKKLVMISAGRWLICALRLTHAAGFDEEERELIRLRYDEGLSQRDAADAMGATRRRVRTVEDRIRVGLEQFLRDRKLLD